MSSEGEAIPFINISEEGHFEVNSKAMNLLQKYDTKKIACISIAGPYRSGKSFLANRFLNQMRGFEIGSTQKSCTRGIWIWNKPIEINAEVQAFLIDTEGLHSVDRYTDLDAKIFTLSVLLSSVFVYNTLGHITSNSIEELNLVVNLAKNFMRLREYDGEEDKEPDDVDETPTPKVTHTEDEVEELSHLLPSLFWVLRDFSLDLESFTSSEYLDDCLKKVYGKSDPKLKNNAIKKYFSHIECHPLVRPVFKESELAHVQDQDYESLRPDFRSQIEILINRVMKRPKLKMIGNKHVTGSMLLGLAMEYTEAINNGSVPTILDSFERVAHSEAQRFVDELIEKNKTNLKYTINDSCLPMDEENLNEIFDEFVKKGIKNLAFKLYETVSVNAFVEVKKQFVKNMKEEFREINKKNFNSSMKSNYDQLVKLSKSLKIGKIESAADMVPSFISTYYDEYNKLCIEYEKSAVGPAKTEAFCKFIEQDFSISHQSLLEDIDMAFKEKINNIQIQILELTQSEQKWESIINNLKNSIISSEEQREKLNEEKHKLEDEIETMQWKINDSTNEHNKKIELRVLELKSAQQLLQSKISEKQEAINEYKKEIEELETTLQSNKDQKLALQREKVKEISTRKNKLQIMKDEYAQRKQKFKDRSDFIALNSTFKVIKGSLDDVKALISESDDARAIKAKMKELENQLEEKEEYGKSIELTNLVKHRKQIIEERQKYISRKQETTDNTIKDELLDLDAKAKVLRMKKKMLLKENKLLMDQVGSSSNSLIQNTSDLIGALKDKDADELGNLENLQTRFYKETVKMANLCEDIDNIANFIGDFVRNAAAKHSKRAGEVHIGSFQELNEDDQENINDLLSGLNIYFT